jgi:glycosyltransferase involved in cell wall biosynthesis
MEDFGIAPVEAQACGCPVVALDQGGARETILDGQTGVLVADTETDAFAEGLERVLRMPFDPAALRENALRFSRQRFLESFHEAVTDAIAEKYASSAARWSPPVREADREAEP